MTTLEAVGLWVGLNVLLMFFLKGMAGYTRSKTKVDYGAGDNERMQRMLRVQGNAVEDVPIALIGLGALGLMSAPVVLIHGLGGGLLASRILHVAGLGSKGGISFGRVAGTAGSVLVLLVTGIACLWFALA